MGRTIKQKGDTQITNTSLQGSKRVLFLLRRQGITIDAAAEESNSVLHTKIWTHQISFGGRNGAEGEKKPHFSPSSTTSITLSSVFY
jgi:hypothetical protein